MFNWSKNWKIIAGSIPLHTTIYQTLFARLQTTFLDLLETSCQNDTYWVKREDPMEFTDHYETRVFFK